MSERLLFTLSRAPEAEDYQSGTPEWSVENALQDLERVFPDFPSIIRERRVLDFGCGTGYQSVAFLKHGAQSVLGLDINPRLLTHARTLAAEYQMNDRVCFAERLGDENAEAFDVVVSQNSMEHFPDPASVLQTMRRALRPGGRILLTFGPPWLAPYGSHMHFFTRVPWVNLLFKERTVMSVRARFRNDGATRYEDVESGLNRMTVRKFEQLVRESGLRLVSRRYAGVKGLDLLTKVPGARELFTNHVNCVLERN